MKTTADSVSSRGPRPNDDWTDNPLLTAQEVSHIASIPVSTLHDLAVRREAYPSLPNDGPVHVRLGPRRRRWLLSDVSDFLNSRRVTG